MKVLCTYKLLLLVLCLGSCFSLSSQIYFDTARSVKVYGTINDGVDLSLNWVADADAESHSIWTREIGNGLWDSLATLSATSTVFNIGNIPSDQLQEYRVIKKVGEIDGYGYLLIGRELAPRHIMGRLLILIETESQTIVQETLEEYTQVLKSEGWLVNIVPVDQNTPVSEVKRIVTDVAEMNGDLLALLILGDVPVPHSGDINPDAHLNHKGAWSADLYYGDVDGVWTDTDVNNTTSDNPRNHNVPADGKLDQSFIPSDIDLEVGRVDFSELPAFADDEYQLLEQYLRKDIDYRTKVFAPIQRAAIKQTNQWEGGLGQNGFRNFSPLASPDSIKTNVFTDGFARSYQWFYGGGSGSYTSATFMGNTGIFASDSLQFVFTSFFGSYFGDYDYEDNYLRAVLGSGTVLSSAWVGAPHWFYHPMGMGYTLGYCTRLTQNNRDIYSGGFFPRSVHVNLLGDPTLKAYILAPPTELLLSEIINGVQLAWTASEEANVYYLYRKPKDSDGHFELLTAWAGTSYIDFCTPTGQYDYLVRATKLEVTPSGSFHNLSSGTGATITVSGEYPVSAQFDITEQDGTYTTANNSANATRYTWILPSGLILLGENIAFELSSDSINLITLIATNSCKSDTLIKEILPTNSINYQPSTISLYPNPVSNMLTIVTDRRQLCTLMDADGAVMKRFHIEVDIGNEVDVSSIPAGVYTIKAVSEKKISHLRFINL